MDLSKSIGTDNEFVCVKLSGGADSAIIYYAVCDAVKDKNTKIIVITLDTDLKDQYIAGAKRIIKIVKDLTGVEPYEHITNTVEHSLENYNNGRPIIFAGHSQGSTHICLLLKEFFDDKDLSKQLLIAYGITYLEAINEADELCGYLMENNLVDGCISDDMDMFVYGCNKVYRYLSLLNSTVVQYDLRKILQSLNLTIDEFKQICILSGTDYNVHLDDQINIYGALKLFGKYKKKNGDDFFQWLNDNNRISDYNKLNDVYNMFNVYNMDMDFSRSKFRNKFYNSEDVRNIMQKNGFIYIN